MRVRGAVRVVLQSIDEDQQPPLVLVALSGGADSLALAAATALEAKASGVRAGAVIIDHGLQQGSEEVAALAAAQAEALGLSPVTVRRVSVDDGLGSATGGTEAAARNARYEALSAVAHELGASCVLTAHTRDDQAEQVLLALARGSGTRSIAGIPPARELSRGVWLRRPLLAEKWAVTRVITETACAELGLEPWSDPHNLDPKFARVRVRRDALPLLERQLGPGFSASLARSADLAREDADALDELAHGWLRGILELNDTHVAEGSLPVKPLADLPSALRNRVLRIAALSHLGTQLSREHTLAVAALVGDWKGQGPIEVPGGTVKRDAGHLLFRSNS